MDFTSATSSTIHSMQKKGMLDLAIITAQPKSTKNLSYREVYSDFFGLFCAPNIAEDFFDNLIFIPFEPNDTQSVRKQFCFTQSMQCDNLETVISLTEQGVGIGLLPHRVARESVIARRLQEFKHPKIKNNSFDPHAIQLICNKNITEPEHSFVIEELLRYLELWSKN